MSELPLETLDELKEKDVRIAELEAELRRKDIQREFDLNAFKALQAERDRLREELRLMGQRTPDSVPLKADPEG
jgi:hypothetical protein